MMANYDQAKYDAYHSTPIVTPVDTARDASLTERLETLTAGLAECHGLLDLLTGVGPAPGGQDASSERGAFQLVEESLAQMVHLRKRLHDLSQRIGRL